jgi:hypothetical protein
MRVAVRMRMRSLRSKEVYVNVRDVGEGDA